MPPPEWALLSRSILEDGWTQPLVARSDGEIVDGYHRWRLVQENPAVAALTRGLVPVVRLTRPLADQMMATIRHNRARGLHAVLKMADIVRALLEEHGLSPVDLERRLSMEPEEVTRLVDRAGPPGQHVDRAFSSGWIPR